MNEIMRICASCGRSGPLEARFCPHCGHDAEAGAPTGLERRNLPVAVTRAALPVLAGVATLAVRAAWQLVRNRMAASLTAPPPQAAQPTRSIAPVATPRSRRVIRIRSTWAVGDANGNWRKGASDHTIEIDD
jgi:hypothetical protein